MYYALKNILQMEKLYDQEKMKLYTKIMCFNDDFINW